MSKNIYDSYDEDNFDGVYTESKLTSPVFFNFSSMASLVDTVSANFFRTILNSNINMVLPLGNSVASSIYESSIAYLPANTFNKKKEISSIMFPNNSDALILDQVACTHDIVIQYKINKSDGTNFSNQREIRVTLVGADNTVYNDSVFSNQQPDSGEHGYMLLKGNIIHTTNDIIKIKINIVQDNKLNDQSDSLLTIFLISWNILVLKS